MSNTGIDKNIVLSKIMQLCEMKGISPNAAYVESGVGKNFKSNCSKSNPSIGKITMLANYFGVSVDYILGNTDSFDAPAPSQSPIIGHFITEKEKALIAAYRAHPEMQPAIDKLLGLDENMKVYTAAKSDDNIYDEYTGFNDEEFAEMKNTPESEDVN